MFFKKTGILGINARNLLYLRPYNAEKSIELADDKLKTKAFLSARNIPVPKLLGVVPDTKTLELFNFKKLGTEFVLKPNLGYGGSGIIPILHREKKYFYGPKEKAYTTDDLKRHILNILNGNFAINNQQDQAFFEKLIISDEILGKYSYQGLPDIRVIVHNLVPVMAMLRLPTKESDGKANLHQGAIGAGIDLAKGEITYLCYKNRIIKEIPNQGSIRGLKIPYWDDILHMACQTQLATNLGYLGADIAIDKQLGPVLLEINARAGIGIQIANLEPLRKRLEKIEGIQVNSITKGIRIAKDMFGYTVEKDIKNISGKKVIGIYEKVEIINQKVPTEVVAFINTSKKRNSINPELAKKLGLIQSKKIKKGEEPKFILKIKINGRKLTLSFKVEKNRKKEYQMVLGSRDISGQFLIDTSIKNLLSKNSSKSKNIFISNYSPIETDRQICKISNQIKLLSYLRPLNFQEELAQFKKDNTHNPQLIYKNHDEEYLSIKKDLKNIRYDDSELGKLFEDKLKELDLFMELIKARGSQEFVEISRQIYGTPSSNDLLQLPPKPTIKLISEQKKKYSSLELKKIFEQILLEYGLKDWRVRIQSNLLAKCMTNKNKRILIKKDSFFTEERIKDLIIHEIETHLLTAENGSRQKYKLFNYGFAGYLETQEGLAMHNVSLQDQFSSEDFHKEALTEAIFMAEKMSFSELYHYIRNKGLNRRSSTDICFRIKRGLSDTSQAGAFTKDYCYFKGKKQLSEYLKVNNDLRDLYLGKFNLKDLSAIKHISSFQTPPLLPKWLTQTKE